MRFARPLREIRMRDQTSNRKWVHLRFPVLQYLGTIASTDHLDVDAVINVEQAMERLVYTLRFHGFATRFGVDGSALMTVATSPGWTVHTRIDAKGLASTHDPADGYEATLESEVTFTGGSMFQEAGTITFGPGGHRLRFSTVGNGYLAAAAGDGCRHGAVVRRIEGGEGQFAGATGVSASVLVLSGSGEVTDHLVGLVVMHERSDP